MSGSWLNCSSALEQARGWARRRALRLVMVVGTGLAARPRLPRFRKFDSGPSKAAVAAALTPGDHERTLTVDGRQRSYLVHVPPSYDPSRPIPIVLAFHGALMNATRMVSFSGLSRKADEAGFIAVYPNGVGFGKVALFFNASMPRRGDGRGPPDDVNFTEQLLDDLATVVNLDRRRVFATGLSNGGMMTHRVAAELSDRIAAAAPVAGTLALPAIHPSRPVPMIMFHGTADLIVPFAGPHRRSLATMQFRSVPDTLKSWRDADGCNGDGRAVTLSDLAQDGTTVVMTTYGPGLQGAEVVLVRIDGGGHTWPGKQPVAAFLGLSSRNVAANDLMWDFFCRHPMP